MSHDDLDAIPARLADVRRRIEDATRKAGRPPGSARLIAVSKEKPAACVEAAYAAGQRDFGENYVQELVQKAADLHALEGLRWHAIGQLQRNKVKLVARVASFVHTVDRAELAVELDRRAKDAGRTIEVLIEVNIAGEATKGGCAPGDVGAVLEAVGRSPHLVAVGLMTMPPYADDPELARPAFAALRELRDRHGGAAALPELSMGMSHDFEVAIAEGATLVRVGTAIFGVRSAHP